MRLIERSAKLPHCPPMRPWLLSKWSSTEARPTGWRSPAPLKITSCIDSPRSADAFDSPSTQRTASITFDLPQPFGPTMPTSRPGVASAVGSTNDLNPASLIWVRRKGEIQGSERQSLRYVAMPGAVITLASGCQPRKKRNYSRTDPCDARVAALEAAEGGPAA